MKNSKIIDISSSNFEEHPFPHFISSNVLENSLDIALLNWFEETNLWGLTRTEFYEQYEFNLTEVEIPENLKCLIEENTIDDLLHCMKNSFQVHDLELVSVTAHKHVKNQSIGIHNDYINGEETHRLVIQINSEWSETKGGYIMLFNSSNAEDVAKVIRPINNSGLGFEISHNSNHAVSKILDFVRYSIVYTFKAL
jgi:Rps23 Pro-64 3,4-dihydroxylase Tpa1-like proline 4-hydroxylase